MSLIVSAETLSRGIESLASEVEEYRKARQGTVYMSPAAVQGELHTILFNIDDACARHDKFDFLMRVRELALVSIFCMATDKVGGFIHVRDLLDRAAMLEGKAVPPVSKAEGKKHEVSKSG